jgi:hypothetical protein
MNAAFF